MDIIIREINVTESAYQQLLVLRDEVLRKPLGMSVYNDDLSKDHEEVILAALDEDELIGCLMMKKLNNSTGKLRQMAVAKQHQGKGIGRQLIITAERIAKNKGQQTLELHARKTAVHFYKEIGYTTEGDEFTEVGIPHFFMKKTLHDKSMQ